MQASLVLKVERECIRKGGSGDIEHAWPSGWVSCAWLVDVVLLPTCGSCANAWRLTRSFYRGCIPHTGQTVTWSNPPYHPIRWLRKNPMKNKNNTNRNDQEWNGEIWLPSVSPADVTGVESCRSRRWLTAGKFCRDVSSKQPIYHARLFLGLTIPPRGQWICEHARWAMFDTYCILRRTSATGWRR